MSTPASTVFDNDPMAARLLGVLGSNVLMSDPSTRILLEHTLDVLLANYSQR